MQDQYRVNHHLIQIVYFDDNSMPPCETLARLWTGLEPIGKRSISGVFCEAANPRKLKLRRLKLGTPEVFASLLADPDAIIVGGGADARKNAARPSCDVDFYFNLNTSGRCRSGVTPPNFQLAISDDWINSIGYQTLLDVIKNNFEILDSSSPFYGFIDIDSASDAYAGHMYTAMGCGNAPLSRFVDRAQWARSLALKRDQARSIYWGNYFGPRLLQKLGGRAAFLDAYVEQGRMMDGRSSALIWEFRNGVFLSLCCDPQGCLPGSVLDFSAERNMQWLYERLCDADAIIGA